MPNLDLLNTTTLNGEGAPTGAGGLASLVQSVGFVGSGELANLEQTVVLRITGSGNQALLEQELKTIGSGNQALLEQKVKDATVLDNVDKFGWNLVVVVGGFTIPEEQLRGMATIVKSEGDSSIAVINIKPPTGIQDLTLYQGKSITVDVEIPSGTFRLFTGVVDIPEVDLALEFLTLRCTNRRRELINSALASITPTIGYYSDQVFSVPKDTAQELDQRLETIPQSLDFDGRNNFSFTNWLPKSTANFTLDDGDIYIDRPRVEVTSRGRVINKINISLEYRYERNYHMQRTFLWESPIKDSVCSMLLGGFTLTHRAMINEAVDAAGWPLRGEISYDAIPADGWYRCGSDLTIGYTSTTHAITTTPKTDASGDSVTDSAGNQVYENSNRVTTSLAAVFTTGASWTSTTRWAQTISENYIVTVQAPQSQSQYGTIEIDESHGVQDDFDSTEWEDYTAYKNLGLGNNFSIDRNDNIGVFNNAFTTILNRAKTTILGSHRDNRVTVSGHYQAGVSPIWPQVELKHTVELTADVVASKGKVFRIEHRFDCESREANAEIELALSKSEGSTSDSPLTLPARPSDSPTIPSSTITLDNHFGEDPSQDGAELWTGYIGNAFISGVQTNFPQSFTVDAPAISAELRDLRNISASVSYDVEIPDDSLTITFDGKIKI